MIYKVNGYNFCLFVVNNFVTFYFYGHQNPSEKNSTLKWKHLLLVEESVFFTTDPQLHRRRKVLNIGGQGSEYWGRGSKGAQVFASC